MGEHSDAHFYRDLIGSVRDDFKLSVQTDESCSKQVSDVMFKRKHGLLPS